VGEKAFSADFQNLETEIMGYRQSVKRIKNKRKRFEVGYMVNRADETLEIYKALVEGNPSQKLLDKIWDQLEARLDNLQTITTGK